MKRSISAFCSTLLVTLLSMAATSAKAASSSHWPKAQPRLVVAIVIDQFRADYLSRFHSKFGKDGFEAMVDNGAYFPLGEYDILQSMTGPGHATILSGSYPYLAGIPLNDWYDQKRGDSVYCVEDRAFETVGAPTRAHVGTSPNNLIGTTVGDELKNAGRASRVVSVALKDRASILMGGHRADLAIWFDNGSKSWVSSRYYLKDGKLPAWMQTLNKTTPVGTCDLSEPCGIDLTESAFEAALKSEKLGQGKDTDVLSVSFSSHDYAGHKFGPNSTEIERMTLSEDRAIARMRKAIASQVPGGLKNVVFVLTGDHGVAPTPEFLKSGGVASERIDETALTNDAEAAVTKACGQPPKSAAATSAPSAGASTGESAGAKSKAKTWIQFVEDFNFFVNEEAVEQSKCDLATVEHEIKKVLLKNPGFISVITGEEWEQRKVPPQMLGRQVDKTYFRGRSGHVVGIPQAFFINASKNLATHMTGYAYDRTVPILFSGFGIRTGLHAEKAEVVDIAPTLSFMLGLVPPALNEGHVLTDALDLKQ